MTKPIFANNDLNVGIDMIDPDTQEKFTGLTIRAWLSDQYAHSTDTPADPIDPDLDVTIAEEPPLSGLYPKGIDKLKITEHLIDATPNFVYKETGEEIFLHREDSTGYHTVERCRVYAERWVLT